MAKSTQAPKIFRRIFLSKNFQPAAQASSTQDPGDVKGMVEVRSSNGLYMDKALLLLMIIQAILWLTIDLTA